MRMGSRRPTRYVLVPGPVIIPGLSPSTRPTSSLGVAVVGKGAAISARSYAEVAMLDVRTRPQLDRGAVPHHPPLLEDVVMIGQPGHGLDVLVDQQNRQAALLEALEAAPDLGPNERRQPLGGLVEDQQRGIRHEGATDGEHLLLAAGQIGRAHV